MNELRDIAHRRAVNNGGDIGHAVNLCPLEELFEQSETPVQTELCVSDDEK